MKAVLCALAAAAALGAAGAAAGAGPQSCGTLSLQAGSVFRGARDGPTCLLQAFRACRTATFTLSDFGVDTEATERFRVVGPRGSCRVAVAAAFRVVPQRARTESASCRALRRTAGDVVAVGCTGSLGRTISLTGRR